MGKEKEQNGKNEGENITWQEMRKVKKSKKKNRSGINGVNKGKQS